MMRGLPSIFCTIILVITVATRTTGQPSYIFRHLATEDGLSNSKVSAILRDSYGFLWIGTLGGGIQCLRGEKASLDSLVTVSEDLEYALDLFYDGEDKLYIGTVYGLYVIDIISDNCSTYVGNSKENSECNIEQTTCNKCALFVNF